MKIKKVFFCNECGYECPKWMGKCPSCGEWNTIVEEVVREEKRNGISAAAKVKSVPMHLGEIKLLEEDRFATGITELDRVLGGGIVKGSLILVGGDPGIGKSTILLQMCQTIKVDGNILYVSAEESQKQVKLRADRLKVDTQKLLLLAETDLEVITEVIEKFNPSVIIIDSVQTTVCPDVSSAPGSVSQVREVTLTLMRLAKEKNIAVFLVGHVTKDGAIAGPKVLEHMVDCVLYFEGERHQFHRILRAVKNRYGSTNEIGVFEMTDIGLAEVENPSLMLLTGRPNNVSGSCAFCALEGTRPVIAEVQALVSRTNFPSPRRMSTGIDYNRISLLMAVLEKRLGFQLSTQDAYVNVIGGLKIDEPAADLGVSLAIASSFKDFAIPSGVIAIGEVGLTGEIRAVHAIDKRINEAAKLGFDQIIIPKGNAKSIVVPNHTQVYAVSNLNEALAILS